MFKQNRVIYIWLVILVLNILCAQANLPIIDKKYTYEIEKLAKHTKIKSGLDVSIISKEFEAGPSVANILAFLLRFIKNYI